MDTQANDPDMMRRPASISSARSGVTLWSSGTYKYDGSGNVVKTGNGYFLYDRVSRLTEGRIQDGPTGGGTQKWQSYTALHRDERDYPLALRRIGEALDLDNGELRGKILLTKASIHYALAEPDTSIAAVLEAALSSMPSASRGWSGAWAVIWW